MQKFIIQGQKTLSGEIEVAGDKNIALKLIPAAMLIPGVTKLENVPNIVGTGVMSKLVESLGGKVERSSDGHKLEINAESINKTELLDDLMTKERSSSMFAGPLLARFGEIKMRHPGGDVIGERPLDRLLDGLETLGAKVEVGDHMYHIKADKLKGAKFVFRSVSVTVTENLIMAACLAEGKTTLVNAAMEPGVVELAEFLNKRGARISGAGSPTIIIEGVETLNAIDEPARIAPDRIEAGTFACMAAASKSEILIKNCIPDHMDVFLKMISLAGVEYKRESDSLLIKKRTKPLKPLEVVTHEYPGLATDYQPPFVVMLSQAQGISVLRETIFEGRLFYTDKLKQMGAKIIMADPYRVIIEGPSPMRGRKIVSPDIRAGIGLVIAGLIAEGKTTIGNIYQIDRGYERIDERLSALGADIKREETDYF